MTLLAGFFATAATVRPRDSAGVVLQPAGWFASIETPGLKSLEVRPAAFAPVSSESLLALRSHERVLPRILVVNQSSAAVEGILIRYDFALEIAPAQNQHAAAWAVPFIVDEWRIPRLKSGESKIVPLDAEILRQILSQVAAGGFIAERLRFEAILEPRPGDARPLQKISASLELKP